MFRKTLVARALAAAFGAAAMSAAVIPVAHAQSNATGSIVGRVDPGAATAVVIESIDNGSRRSVVPDAQGRFQAGALPPGNYKVSMVKDGTVVRTQDNIEVLIGQNRDISFAATALESVQVVGRRQVIDVENTNSGVTFSANDLDKLPIARSLSAIIQLAPNSTRGDTRYGGVDAPSIGGASASENSFYINGFPVTNIFFQIGYSQLPFGGISQAQVLSGGYGAEFGRSLGGVVNITTKSGTNEWKAGGQITWDPNSLRAKQKSNYYDNSGKFPLSDGKLYLYHGADEVDRMNFGGYIGGPIIKDKLFFFFAGDYNKTDIERVRSTQPNSPNAAGNQNKTAGWESVTQKNPRYMAKFDFNITDANRLEWTHISDEYKDNREYSGFDYRSLTRNGVVVGGDSYVNYGPGINGIGNPQGSKLDILKYTGYLNDNLTLTALYGHSKTIHLQTPAGSAPGVFQILQPLEAQNLVPSLNYPIVQTASGSVVVPGANDKQDGLRLDLEYKLGKHTIRGGVDYIKQKSLAGTALAGGGLYQFQRGDPNAAVSDLSGTPASGGGFGTQGYYVETTLTSSQESPSVIQSAQYIEDRWQITDRLLLSLGLRNEQFTNKNGLGEAYIRQTKQLEPRVGAAWDVNGDSSTKVFGNAGRYHIQIPTSIALRGAGASLNTNQFFTYTGIDQATGAPTGLKALGPVESANGEFGIPRNAKTVSDQNLKGMYQDELSFGMEQSLSRSMTVGAKLTYRKLGESIDDWCDTRPFEKWATANGKGTAGLIGDCFLINPGRGATINYDVDGDGKLEQVVLSAADIGNPKGTRKYYALDLFAEHPFDGKWYGRVNYTFSRNWGNTEGQLLSDLGQADVGATQTWDYPEFSRNASGVLPNNRTHQIKAFGFYQITSEFGVGGNLLLASGRPRVCKGVDPTDKDPDGSPKPYFGAYTSPSFFCFGAPTSRGGLGNLPWDRRLDLNVAYRPTALKGLLVKLDIFNVFNSQTIETFEERSVTATNSPRSVYGRVVSYSAPKSGRITVAYDYQF